MLSDHRSYDCGDVIVVKHVRIPMSDGIQLAADLYGRQALLTASPEPLPVVLDYIPYRKDEVELGGWGAWYYTDLVRAGYIVARVDIRGTGSSDGIAVDEYSPDELSDGYATVEWLGRQSWCDGHVCMTGISYGGFTSLLIAGMAPPALTAIAPMFFGEDRYANGDHYRGGLLGLWFDLGYYGTYLAAFNLLPPDPLEPGWHERWLERLGSNEPYLLRWLKHQTDGEFWRGGSAIDVVDRIACPALLIGGWRDAYPNGPFRIYDRLTGPKRMIVGPWNHAVPDIAIPGPRIDYVREIVAWFDRWCGRDAGTETRPPVSVYMQRSQAPDPRRVEARGDWRAEPGWPPAGVRQMNLYPASAGTLVEDRQRGHDSLRHEPAVGVTGGLFCYMSFGQSGDQRADDALSLTYTSEPLEHDLAILGPPRLKIRLTSPVEVIALVVALCDVAPDGCSMLVTKGVLNATRRNGLSNPEPVPVGVPIDLDILLDATGWVFERGRRIRLRVACADWPNLWPTPEAATLAIDRGATQLALPVVDAESPLSAGSFAAAPERDMRPATLPRGWGVKHDLATGEATFELEFGRSYSADAGSRTVERWFDLTATVDPAAPADAHARGRHRSVISGEGFSVSSTATTTIQASRASFQVTIDVEVEENGAPLFRRTWREDIARVLL